MSHPRALTAAGIAVQRAAKGQLLSLRSAPEAYAKDNKGCHPAELSALHKKGQAWNTH